MGSGASQLTEGVTSSSVEELRDCVASLEAKQRRVLREAVKKASYVHPCENMPEVPGSLKELWPTLGERFGPYNFLFAEDPTEFIRGQSSLSCCPRNTSLTAWQRIRMPHAFGPQMAQIPSM